MLISAALAVALLLVSPDALAQTAPPAKCGSAKIALQNPQYLITPAGILALELPPGWTLYAKKKNPFFLLRTGDQYETARTVIYINLQKLEGSFEQDVLNDENDFKKSDPEAKIEDEPRPEILEAGCKVKAQRFTYKNRKKTYVDQVTKIGIGGLLLNIVLSSDSGEEIEHFMKDYDEVLKHLALTT
jgi:hypothetical protein